MGPAHHALKRQNRTIRLLLACASTAHLAILYAAAPSHGQTIINVPPDIAPTSIGANAVLNLSSGGVLPAHFHPEGGKVNLFGGTVKQAFFEFSSVKCLTIFGTSFKKNGVPVGGLSNPGDKVDAFVTGEQLFTGVLADGTPFAFTSLDGDKFFHSISLELAAPPLPGPAVITLPGDVAPQGVRSGQSLNVAAQGALGAAFNAGEGSIVNIVGGRVGSDFEAVGAAVNISGGTFGNDVDVFAGSTATIYGRGFQIDGSPVGGLTQVGDDIPLALAANSLLSGTLEDGTPFAFTSLDSDMFSNGTLHLKLSSPVASGPVVINLPAEAAPPGVRSGQTLELGIGGIVENSFNAGAGSVVNVSGGLMGNNFEAVASIVNLSSGTIDPVLFTLPF